MKYRKWEDNYSLAAQLCSEIGTVNVPIDYEYKGYNIGYWISRQRSAYNQNLLRASKIARLEKLGIVWDGMQIKRDRHMIEFSKRIDLLRDYKEKYGNTRVPEAYTVDGFALGKWLTGIRQQYRHPDRRKLTAEQMQMLEDVGFEPSWYENQIETNWITNFQLLLEFTSSHSIDDVKEGVTYKGVSIGNWLHTQRNKYYTGTLPEEKYEKLHSIGVVFSPIEKRWDDLFLLASQYYHELRNLDVPDGFIFEGQDLGRWISYQRTLYNKSDGSLSPEKTKKLESIGMKWEIGKSGSSSFAEQAVFFYLRQLFPDVVNRDTTYGFELDNYIPSLKLAIEYDGEYWHRNKEIQDNEKDAKCDSLGVMLVRIREYPLPVTKSAKCFKMESKYSHSVIEEVIKTIFQQQFSSDVDVDIARDAFDIIKEYERYSSKSWYAFYEAAKIYYHEEGDLLVPAKYTTESGMRLGSWIQNQRQAYKGQATQYLSNYEVELLESIGMVWDIREAEWDRMYSIATKYYEEHGDLIVPRDCVYENINLGRWINTQRNVYSGKRRRQIMSEDRIQKLEHIGMVWNVLEYEWNRMYAIASKYYEEYGDLNIFRGRTYHNESLGDWVYTQKQVYYGKHRNQVMPEDKKRKLEAIGIVW